MDALIMWENNTIKVVEIGKIHLPNGYRTQKTDDKSKAFPSHTTALSDWEFCFARVFYKTTQCNRFV